MTASSKVVLVHHLERTEGAPARGGACRREGTKKKVLLKKIRFYIVVGAPYRGRILTGSHVTLLGYHVTIVVTCDPEWSHV